MPVRKQDLLNTEFVYWTTITIAFVLLIHNGYEPLFILAYALIPFLTLIFYKSKKLYVVAIYLLLFGILGRYTRYFRENYASDTLLAVKDYIGYFLAGKNPYKEIIYAANGLTPFTYLPFTLFWYLPAQIMHIDLRFMEMIVSGAVPILVFVYGMIKKNWKILPVTAVVALTPFLLDLSADGSNDNSAIFLLLISIILFKYALTENNKSLWNLSAAFLGLAAAFKHHVFFYLLFFIPYIWTMKNKILSSKKYLLIFSGVFLILILPFALMAPVGFYKSQFFIEIGNYHPVWGWNIWVALRDFFHISFARTVMWRTRTIASVVTIIGIWLFYKLNTFRRVLAAAAISMLVYLMTSDWTTYAYFTFLVPLLGIAAVSED